ncbi:flagellar biosynthesis protein FlgB [Haematospirillum jordaniae]|uniref:Flagellar basal body rod protein FlgB n=1 Tax=Haematospirillum jordaniae TaxID=1549855 RepID=A0A143DB14_9PROT|nr:flagellar biosynthesis protein FlgB [Haematospirillum jordaniae]AMW33826.1 flagellar biosynthesis protein FlgB [Haematospirillum jordaniae]NKD44539.1 flagellar biosynthesis protein FlgB [Haematospirillum jordaniae]NKD57559.1 flagellar biosynthesis protein FlgB [Haematospirillum jordaniae]NKD59463.1 flagellar biosynthesis protein FlgB [Haematospirillum jordaniae]NKD67458.1 flagellar biosynthesis protein FlgB [Haematospirillum jordaniae]
MDTSKLSLFRMARTKMDWLAQRQRVLAQNISNADTPKFKAKDLRELDFGKMVLDATEPSVKPAMTNPSHMGAALPDLGPYREVAVRRTWERSIDGNPVVLEEQMEKMARGRSQYDLALQLVKKNLTMIKSALGQR